MPQDHTLESALTHLRGRGYVLTNRGWWYHPNVANVIADEDFDAIDYLAEQSNFYWGIELRLDEDEG